MFLALALAAATAVFLVPLRCWQKAAPWLFAACVVLLVLVLIPGIGREVNGARRWLTLGVATMQPSELMKLAVVLYAADYTVRKHAVLKNFKRGLLPMLAVMLVVAWLLLREPDFGAFVVIAVTAFGVLFLGGMNGRHFAALLGMLGGRLRRCWCCPRPTACSASSASWIPGPTPTARATSCRTR